MSTIQLHIITPEKTLYTSEVDSLTVMTESGEITVLPGHVPLVSVLVAGDMHVVKSGQIIAMVTGQGVIEIQNNECNLLVNTAEHIDSIDEERAREAAERAQQYMNSKQFSSDVEYARMQALLDRNLARIRGLEKWKK